jgi:ribosomal protein S4
MVVEAVKNSARRERLPFVEADDQTLTGKLIAEPQLSDLPIPIQESLIVELYSKV